MFLGTIVFQTLIWASVVINVTLRVILIARLHAMYQHSRKVLIFLIATSLALTIACGVMVVILSSRLSEEELVLSTTYQCIGRDFDRLLSAETWILSTAWEVLALCLAAWIAVKHFRELQQRPTGWAFGDCLTVLMRSHIFYFAGFAAVAFFTLGDALSPNRNEPVFNGILKVASSVQMSVLGPRLILSVREFHAELVDNSDMGTIMTAIVFQERVHVSSGGDV